MGLKPRCFAVGEFQPPARRAFSMGYAVRLVGDAHSTPYFDDAAIDPPTAIACHSQQLTNFAKVVPSAEVVLG